LPTVEEKRQPLMTIVTSFSENHIMEAIVMLQTLIDLRYTSPIYVYFAFPSFKEHEVEGYLRHTGTTSQYPTVHNMIKQGKVNRRG
jgi:hypothetical protein